MWCHEHQFPWLSYERDYYFLSSFLDQLLHNFSKLCGKEMGQTTKSSLCALTNKCVDILHDQWQRYQTPVREGLTINRTLPGQLSAQNSQSTEKRSVMYGSVRSIWALLELKVETFSNNIDLLTVFGDVFTRWFDLTYFADIATPDVQKICISAVKNKL